MVLRNIPQFTVHLWCVSITLTEMKGARKGVRGRNSVPYLALFPGPHMRTWEQGYAIPSIGARGATGPAPKKFELINSALKDRAYRCCATVCLFCKPDPPTPAWIASSIRALCAIPKGDRFSSHSSMGYIITLHMEILRVHYVTSIA